MISWKGALAPLKTWNLGLGSCIPSGCWVVRPIPGLAIRSGSASCPSQLIQSPPKSKVPTQAAPPEPEPGVNPKQLPTVSVQPILLQESDPFVWELQLRLDLEQNMGYVRVDLLHTSWSASLGPFAMSFPACAKSTLDLSAPGCWLHNPGHSSP